MLNYNKSLPVQRSKKYMLYYLYSYQKSGIDKYMELFYSTDKVRQI